MAVKVTLGNSKGGVGKTIITNLLAFHLAEQGKKVLLVDLDPQGNSTMINRMRYGLSEDVVTLIDGVHQKNLSNCILKLQENLFLLPGDARTAELEVLLPTKSSKNHVMYLAKLIDKIEGDYDFIFYDVPPTAFSAYLNNALGASDYYVILTEATKQSFSGIGQFYHAAMAIQTHFNSKLDCLGIIVNRREKDVANFKVLDEEFEISTDEMFFETMIPSRTRIGKYSEHGLYNFSKAASGVDMWDEEVKKVISELVEEILARLGGVEFEAVKQEV